MSRLVFDIETIGEPWSGLDETTQHVLTSWVDDEAADDADRERLTRQIREGLGFSPLTGEIVAIGVLDVERDKGVVYYQSPDTGEIDTEKDGIRFRPMSEKLMLEHFWSGAKDYDEFIGFNSRAFDAPFLEVRSAIHGITPSVRLMDGRYLYQQRDAKHIDLRDQLSYYGAVRRSGGLHLWCRAFGIESPKAGGTTGDDVAGLFKTKRYLDIATYNVGDLRATKALYLKWNEHLRG
jgi:DNA polymerase elongation subunit (family B)